MNKRSMILVSTLSVIMLLALTVGLTLAQVPDQPQGADGATAVAPGAIPIQGRVTDAGGAPLNGTYTMTFALYEVETGGSALCADANSVTVQNGLFNSYVDYCYDGNLWGQKVWLGIRVGSDPEMTPRQVIYPVPYALGLVPGVVISASHANPFSVRTTSASGRALEGVASAATGTTYGVVGQSNSEDGYGGYFYNYNPNSGVGVSGISIGGPGVVGGAAIAAEGTGRITSTAKSYIWISGNGVRPYHQSDSTSIDMDSVGGAKITRGATAGNKNVMLPIALPGTLYGQNVRVVALDVYWSGDTDFDAISAILLRRQTGVCETATCYASLLNDGTDRTCEDSVYPTGCTVHFDLTSNNTLTANSGVLYLTVEMAFSGASTWVEIGGVRLTLEHD
jgi:hypothetical protein